MITCAMDEYLGAYALGALDGDEEIHFPKRLSWPLKIFTALPRPLYESLARRFMTKS